MTVVAQPWGQKNCALGEGSRGDHDHVITDRAGPGRATSTRRTQKGIAPIVTYPSGPRGTDE